MTNVELTLRRGTGRLTVVTEPRSAWIEHGGERLAAGTPVTLANLPAGTVALRIGADEHRTAEVSAEVPKGGVGRLERDAGPDSVRHADAWSWSRRTPAVTLPDVVPAYSAGMRLPEGPHRVVVRRDGYREETRTVAVAGDTRERIELALGPQPFRVSATPSSARVQLVGSVRDLPRRDAAGPGRLRRARERGRVRDPRRDGAPRRGTDRPPR